MQYFSHLNKKLLIEHLKEVNDIAQEFLNGGVVDRLSLKVACLCHDFGKFTTYFQDYLFKNKKQGNRHHHGFISALFSAHVAMETFGDTEVQPLLIYHVVLHHHGNLKNFDSLLPFSSIPEDHDYPSILRERMDVLAWQIADIQRNQECILEQLQECQLDCYLKKFLEVGQGHLILKKLKAMQRKLKRKYNKNEFDSHFFIHQMLYSALISADKISASGIRRLGRKVMNFEELADARNKEISSVQKKAIDTVREEVFQKIQHNMKLKGTTSKIFTITSPTGTGKTYSGFFAALKLREILGGENRIIYTLPFTSIIDQNYQVISNLLKNLTDFNKEKNRYVIKHHHLSDVDYVTEEENFSKSEALLLMEDWEAEIIVSTFVQFFETLAGHRNRMLKKLHSFKKSIVVLDELQTVPIKYWNFVEYLLIKATEELDMRIIVMTATKPIVFFNACELLPDYENYFGLFNRVRLFCDLKRQTIEDFSNHLKTNLSENKSYLVICNTINTSLYIYRVLNEYLGENRSVLYLSTNLIPLHRQERIAEVREMLINGEKPILVATQVVEAGVDFDFDVVIRDIGPIDSIIQAAGRCNRNGERAGEGRVVCLVNDKGMRFADPVYGPSLINISEKVLNKEYFDEQEFLDLIKRYFVEAKAAKSKQDSINLIRAIEHMDFDSERGITAFQLISNRPNYIDVYFEVDENAVVLRKAYLKQVVEERDRRKRIEAFLELKNKLSEYTISLPDKFVKFFEVQESMYVMPAERVGSYYSCKTGFEREIQEESIFL